MVFLAVKTTIGLTSHSAMHHRH